MTPEEHGIDADECGGNAAPYVLNALSDEECESFVAHLHGCAVCREEVAALQVVVSALPAAAPQVSAPEDLKRRVMTTVRQEASLHPQPAAARPPRRAARARGLTAWRPAALAGAALAALAALLVVVLTPGAGSPPARTIRAQVLAPRASATLRLSGGHAELNVADMPQPTPNRVYEVWVKRSGAAQPTDALFTVSSAGSATVGVPGSVSGVKEILVTSEPRGGSRVPTRSPVIVARLS